jgi:hypothetical protein
MPLNVPTTGTSESPANNISSSTAKDAPATSPVTSAFTVAPRPRPRPQPPSHTQAGANKVSPVLIDPVVIPLAVAPPTARVSESQVLSQPIINPLYVKYIFFLLRSSDTPRDSLFGPAVGPSARLDSLSESNPAVTKLKLEKSTLGTLLVSESTPTSILRRSS